MAKRNEIVIDSTRHIFKEMTSFYPCRQCSLHYLCLNDPLCQRVYGRRGYFEIYERK